MNEDFFFSMHIYSFPSEDITHQSIVVAFLITGTSHFYSKIGLLNSLWFIFCYLLHQRKNVLFPITARIKTKHIYKDTNKSAIINIPSF